MTDQNFRVKRGLEVGVGATVLFAHPNGLVGVGTTNPKIKLEVDGQIGFTQDNILIGDKNTGSLTASGYKNIFMGVGAGSSNTTGCYNTFLGNGSGSFASSGNYNTQIGNFSGYYNEVGSYNNFFGASAGYYNQSGNRNNFFGNSSGLCNVSGCYNNFIGNYTGIYTNRSYRYVIGNGLDDTSIFDAPSDADKQFAIGLNTTGESEYWIVGNENLNVGIGTTNPKVRLQLDGVLGFGTFVNPYNTIATNIRIGDETTGANLTDGSANIFMGVGAGNSTTIGRYNNFIGHQAGYYNVLGDWNNFFGYYAGYYNTNGGRNNFLGYQAGFKNNIGFWNNFLGSFAGRNNISGCNNNFFGLNAGYCNTTGSNNNFFGRFIGLSTSSSNKVVIGSGNVLAYLDSPDINKDNQLAIGIRSDSDPANYWLVGNENFNVGIGTTNPQTKLEIGGQIGFSDTNVLIGDNTTGASLTPGTPYPSNGITNIFIGVGAGNSTTIGAYNNYIGLCAGYFNSIGAYGNNFIGACAGLYSSGGFNNNFFGSKTGYLNIGNYNNFFGYCAGYGNTTGTSNNFFGPSAGSCNTTGSGNNYIGQQAGWFNTSGNNNNLIGFCAGAINFTGNCNNFFGAFSGYCNLGNHNNYFGSYSGISTTTSYKVILGSGVNPAYLFDSPNTTKSCQFAVGIRTDNNPSKYWIVGDENFNVGIGTTNPTAKLDVIGDVKITGVTTITGNLNAAGNYYAKLARTTNQTITNGVDTPINLSVISDTNNWYSGITTRTTPTVAGTYQVNAMLSWQAGATTNIAQSNIQLRKNGNTFAISLVGIQTFQYTQNACGIVTMNGTTDYIDFTAYTSNPTSQVVNGEANGVYTKMEIFKIN